MPDVGQSMLINGLLILAAVALVVAGAWLIQRARQGVQVGTDPQEHDPLATYREALRRGQMDEAEYRQILGARESRLRGEPARPVDSPAPATPPPPPGETGPETPPPAASGGGPDVT